MRDTLRLSLHIVTRNWWVYRKDFIANISPTITEPSLTMLALGVGLGAYVAEVNGHTYLQYLAPGLAVSTAMFTAFFETSYGFYVRMTFENVFKAMLTTPIGVRELVIGEFLWVGVKGAFMMTGVSAFLALFGLFNNLWILPLVPLVGLIIAVPLGAIGLLSSCMIKNINQFQSVYAFLISPLYFFSGIFFPVEQMPPVAGWIARVLPLHHAVRLSQSLFWNERIGEAFLYHAPVLLAYSLVLVTWSYFRLKRKLQS